MFTRQSRCANISQAPANELKDSIISSSCERLLRSNLNTEWAFNMFCSIADSVGKALFQCCRRCNCRRVPEARTFAREFVSESANGEVSNTGRYFRVQTNMLRVAGCPLYAGCHRQFKKYWP